MSWDEGQGSDVVHIRDPRHKALLREWLANDGILVVCHNARHEIICWLAQFPSMRRAIFRKLKRGGFSCTKIRDQLAQIATGVHPIRPRALDVLALEAGYSVPLDKSCPWRLRYGTLIDTPVAEWPTEAVSYSEQDASATLHVWRFQEKLDPRFLVNEQPQLEADVALGLMGCWGIETDRAQADKLVAETEAQIATDAATLTKHGLLRENGTKDKKAAEARLVQAYEWLGKPAPTGKITEKMAEKGAKRGGYKLDEEACLGSQDPVLEAYTRFTQANTLRSKARRLQKPIIQPYFNVLLASGRTSCSQGDDPEPGQAYSAYGFNLQTLPRIAGAREAFRARKGNVFVSKDWDTCELRTLSEVCIELVGFSDMADVLRDPTRDVHVELGAAIVGISTAEAYALKTSDKAKFKELRQLAKAANFGLPGGLGVKTFIATTQRDYGITLAEDQAKKIIDTWRFTWREMPKYLELISKQVGERGSWATIEQLYSKRLRGKCGYTDGANTLFQGLAADLGKGAFVRVMYAAYNEPHSLAYGCRPVNWVHDELITEVPEERLHEASQELVKLMLEGAKPWMRHIPMSTSPAAMRVWRKEAGDPIFVDGRLVAWEDRPR